MAVLLAVNRIWLKEQTTKKSLLAQDVKTTASHVLQFFGVDSSELEEASTIGAVGDADAIEAADCALGGT